MFIPIVPAGASKPIAPYVHGARAGNALYVSGTLAIDQTGAVAHPDDIRGQTRYVIEQIRGVVEAAGGSLQDVAYNMIFISDAKYYSGMNEIYSSYFPNPPLGSASYPNWSGRNFSWKSHLLLTSGMRDAINSSVPELLRPAAPPAS